MPLELSLRQVLQSAPALLGGRDTSGKNSPCPLESFGVDKHRPVYPASISGNTIAAGVPIFDGFYEQYFVEHAGR